MTSSMMTMLLRAAGVIDGMNRRIARAARWCLLANAVFIAGNALSRKLFAVAAPVIYDYQSHFLAAVVLLMAAYTYQRDEHVRIDVFAHHLGDRGLAWLDLGGIALVLLPVCLLTVWVTWPQFVHSLVSGETRASRESLSNLPAWIIKGMIPVGFAMLAAQGVAEAIRCIVFLRGIAPRPRRRRLLEGAPHER